MCQALEELLKDEIDIKVENGRKEGRKQGRDETQISAIKSLMETMKWTAQEAMAALKLTTKEQQKYLAML